MAQKNRRLTMASGKRRSIRKPGIGYHRHSLPAPEPIIDFILSHNK